MKLPRFLAALLALVTAASLPAASDYPIQPVPFTDVRITGGFWAARQETNRAVTVPFALQQCEDSGRMKNFDLAAEVMRRRAAGETTFQIKPPTVYPFDDTDAYKAIEAASYSLATHPDPALAARLEGMIARIAAAQEPDGYLYTFRTMHPDAPGHDWVGQQRWEKDPELSHELYNLGHLYEAGTAHFAATGSRTLLDVCLRNAELVWRDFGDGQRRIAPGHQVIEMGLARLYRVTGDARWLTLADLFLQFRGPTGPDYNQRHAPVVAQRTAVGHAVRANYQYAGMADVIALTGDARYRPALDAIWDNMAGRKLYLTGGVGARPKGEAYGADYELTLEGYAETCAAIGLMMWAQRMHLLTGEARFMDVYERAACNGFLSGVDVAGTRFFYPNPLAYDGVAKNNYGHAGRAPWFGCACCPPNLTRTLAALTGAFYAVRDASLFVNFYAASTGTAKVGATEVKLTQTTDYPWDGRIQLAVAPAEPATFTLRLRIPGWARGEPVPSDLYRYAESHPAEVPAWSIAVNGEKLTSAAAGLTDGYVGIRRAWRAGDVVTLDFPMPVRRVVGHAQVAATAGRVAFERGPMVYCFEDVAGDRPVLDLEAPATAQLTPRAQPGFLGGLTTLETPEAKLTLIPYYAWNNRGLHPMNVWLKASPGERGGSLGHREHRGGTEGHRVSFLHFREPQRRPDHSQLSVRLCAPSVSSVTHSCSASFPAPQTAPVDWCPGRG